jgi:hypothetical protein
MYAHLAQQQKRKRERKEGKKKRKERKKKGREKRERKRGLQHLGGQVELNSSLTTHYANGSYVLILEKSLRSFGITFL